MSSFSINQFKVLAPTAILGYGFPEESFLKGFQSKPDLIAVDAGSVDPGPFYLGAGKSFTSRAGVKRDLGLIVEAGLKHNIPVVVGTAGGSGASPHLRWCQEILLEIARERSLSFKLASISADISPQEVISAIDNGDITSLGEIPDLTKAIVSETKNIVGQMGVEPLIAAHQAKSDVILAGRAYDPAVFAALPIMEGFDPGLALHLGKILECAAIAAEPGSGSDSVLGILEADSFILKPLSTTRRFTKESTAAHALYEKSDPFKLAGPGGHLDLSNVVYEELEDGAVRVGGSRFVESEDYFVKLEGARPVGYRSVAIAGTRDPIMIKQIDEILGEVEAVVKNRFETEGIEGKIFFHLYGKHGVMGAYEPKQNESGHEIGIIIETLAPTQAESNYLCSLTRSTLLHYGYRGRISTAGNLAFPFSPSDLEGGPVYEFSIYHLMKVTGQELFTIEYQQVTYHD